MRERITKAASQASIQILGEGVSRSARVGQRRSNPNGSGASFT